MAVGQVVSLPTNTHKQVFVPSGAQYPTIAILNPNDGIVYVSQNRDTTGTNVGQWDYKIPSQSYALLPGPYMSVGMYYLDQSGGGASGQVTIYPVQTVIPYPDFHAIGRALQTFGSALDINEGSVPANPGAGLLRLWADTNNNLHELPPSGVDKTVIDTATALGGVLGGTLPNPIFAAGRPAFTDISGTVAAGQFANGTISPGRLTTTDFRPSNLYGHDLYADRGDGTGVYYFTTDGVHYLYWDGTQYVLQGNGQFVQTGQLQMNGHPIAGVQANTFDGSWLQDNTVTRAKLAVNAKTTGAVLYAAATAFSSSTAGTWQATPITGTFTSNGGYVLANVTTNIFNTGPYRTLVCLSVDGSIAYYWGVTNPQGGASAVGYPFSATIMFSVSAATHTYTAYMFCDNGTMGIYNNQTSTLTVMELNYP